MASQERERCPRCGSDDPVVQWKRPDGSERAGRNTRWFNCPDSFHTQPDQECTCTWGQKIIIHRDPDCPVHGLSEGVAGPTSGQLGSTRPEQPRPQVEGEVVLWRIKPELVESATPTNATAANPWRTAPIPTGDPSIESATFQSKDRERERLEGLAAELDARAGFAENVGLPQIAEAHRSDASLIRQSMEEDTDG